MNRLATPCFSVFLISLFTFLGSLSSIAEDNAVALDFGDAESGFIGEDGHDDDQVELSKDALITVNYPNEPIRNIIRNVADLYDINVVIPDTLVANTSIKLRDVNWRQIFEILLKPVGFTYGEEGNIIRIMSVDDVSKEPMELRTFPIKYAKAEDVMKSLAPIVGNDTGGSIQFDERSNSIIARARPSALNEVDRLLNTSMIDKPSLQVMIEAKFLEVGTNMNPDGKSDGVGLDWWNGTTALFGGSADVLKIKGMLDLFNSASGSSFETVVPSAGQYAMALQALETTTKNNLLGSPTLVTSNNKEASFHVGKIEPIIEASFDTTTGTYTVGSVNYLDVGVKLTVTPRVNSGADQITLQVKPEVTRINDYVEFSGSTGGKVSYPRRIVRTVTTDVNIKNGYTLALGGLIQDDDIHQTKKVPLLGDLPLVGKIFQKQAHTKEKVNLIMFITAKTLNPDGATYQEVIDPRQIETMGVVDSDLPGYANGVDMPGVEKISNEHKKLLEEIRQKRNYCYNSIAEKKLRHEKRAVCATPQKKSFMFSEKSFGRGSCSRYRKDTGSGYMSRN